MTAQARFNDMYIPDPNSGCWHWTGGIQGAGYGAFWWNKQITAHRASWVLHNGDIPTGLIVCHKCDEKTCVNPDHLFLGTYKENIQDMIRKGRHVAPDTSNRARGTAWHKAHDGRHAGGEGHGMAKLTEQDVIAIRGSSEMGSVMAERYGVTNTHISRIRKHKIWRMVPSHF